MTDLRFLTKRFVRVALPVFALAALVSWMTAGMPGLGDWLTQARTSAPPQSRSFAGQSKESLTERMTELDALLTGLRNELNANPKNGDALAQSTDAQKEYEEISAYMGGDRAPIVGALEIEGPLVAGVAPPAPPGCTATTSTFSNITPVVISTTGTPVVSSTINVAGADTYLYDVDVVTTIVHSFCSDLDITIQSPAGTIVTLTTDNGGANDNVFNGTLWDDDANPAGQVPYSSNNGVATDHVYANLVLASPLVPEEAMGAFVGEDPNGTWTITISDDAGGDGGQLTNWSVNLTTLSSPPTETTTSATNNTPVAIPSGPAVVSSTINFASAGTSITKATLQTFITHTFCADLDITIQSPAGTVVTLTTDNSLATGVAGHDNVFNGTLWDDDANPAGQVPYANNNGVTTDHVYANLVLASPLVPEEAMGAFIGEDPNGIWTITISDDVGGDGGSLNSWTLNITTGACDVEDCMITCPDDITVSNDPDQCGADVIYPAPTSTGDCGTITCVPASGSFFPVGTTTVTCTSSGGTAPQGDQGLGETSVVASKPSSPSKGQGKSGIGAGAMPTASSGGNGKAQPPALPQGPFAVLYSQVDNPAATSTSSQNFEAAFDSFDNEVADDFVVTAGENWTIDQVFVAGAYFNGAGPASSVNVVFYSDTATLPGAVVATRTNQTIADVLGDFTVTLSPTVVLAPGTYWVSVQANQDLGTAGQWGWTDRTTTSNSGSAWHNPGGGFGTACTAGFGRKTTCIANSGPDAIFQILGTSAPIGGGGPTCTFTITVNDTQPPVIDCPDNVTTSNDPDECGAVVNYPPPTVTDNCPGMFTATCSPASGSFFPVGTTTVTCSVDGAPGGPTCTFTITVNDTQPPVIDCPDDVTAVTALTCPATMSTIVDFPPPTASDNCPGVTVACVPASGSIIPVGTTTVTCTATDASSNTATCSFTLSVFDVCLQDDANPETKLLINSFTGDYRFICLGNTTIGKGKVSGLACNKQLLHSPPGLRVRANWTTTRPAGNASLQVPAGVNRCVIEDRDMRDNDCASGLGNGTMK